MQGYPHMIRKPIWTGRFTVVLEKDEDNIYVATVPALPGCISDGRTVEEAMSNIKEAIQGKTEKKDKGCNAQTVHHNSERTS